MKAVGLSLTQKREETNGVSNGVHAKPATETKQEPPPGNNQPAVLTMMSDVQAVPIRWLWPDRIAIGKITIFDGDPGVAKSLVTLDIAARVSKGAPMPNGSRGDVSEARGVVLLCAEDDAADTLVPRLIAADADRRKVAQLMAVRGDTGERWPSLADLPAIRDAVTRTNAALLIIDPVASYLGSKGANKDQEIRELLGPLANLAAELKIAVIIVRHLNKKQDVKALYRGGGTIGFVGAARTAHIFAKDEEDETGNRRVMALLKTNIARDNLPSLAYHVETVQVETSDGPAETPRVVWEGAHRAKADDLVGGEKQPRARQRGEAEEFLRDALADGPRLSVEIKTEAEARGISEITLRRARKALGVVTFPKDDRWWVELPAA